MSHNTSNTNLSSTTQTSISVFLKGSHTIPTVIQFTYSRLLNCYTANPTLSRAQNAVIQQHLKTTQSLEINIQQRIVEFADTIPTSNSSNQLTTEAENEVFVGIPLPEAEVTEYKDVEQTTDRASLIFDKRPIASLSDSEKHRIIESLSRGRNIPITTQNHKRAHENDDQLIHPNKRRRTSDQSKANKS